MFECFICGGQVAWQSDFTFEDFCYEGDGIVQIFTCANCGAEYEVRRRFDEEADDV